MTTNTPTIRVLVADDHPLLREGIAAVLAGHADIELVGEASDGHEALECFRRLRPDVALIDLQMPRMNGIESIAAICSEFPNARIAILTTYRGDVRALHAIRAGAQAYLLKSCLRKELVETVRQLAAGRRHIPPEIACELAQHVGEESLSPRELEVLQATELGLSNRDIACRLGITEDTVKGHVRLIMEKLSARNRTHAVAIGLQRGIIEVGTPL